MPEFMVRCFVDGEAVDEYEPIEARDKDAAANKKCGGMTGPVMAIVYPKGRPGEKTSIRVSNKPIPDPSW